MIQKQGGAKITAEEGRRGTLGLIVYSQKSGEPVILTNHHVLFGSTPPKGSFQNAINRDVKIITRVKTLTNRGRSRPKETEEVIATVSEGIRDGIHYPSGARYEGIEDCAVATFKPDVISRYRRLIGKIQGYGRVRGVGKLLEGQHVVKVGAKTGKTYGTVGPKVNTDSDVRSVTEDPWLLGRGMMGQHGDSGSVVVDRDTGLVVGLLFRRDSGSEDTGIQVQPIQPILDALKLSIVDPNPIPGSIFTRLWDMLTDEPTLEHMVDLLGPI